jgi:methylenetetrahydrofolate reductase (NADPH)
MADKPDGGMAGPDQHAARTPGRLQRVLESAEFAVTAEIGPPRGADAEPVRRKAALLRDWVDAVNITDNQSASVRLASWAGSLAALSVGVAPIMQLTCRDRNRIALQSELISASAMGIPNVLLMTGDHPRFGDHADAKPVFDLDSTELMSVAATMRDEGKLMSGRALDPAPSWLIGAVENPGGPAEVSIARLAAKVAAGAQFVQTQFVFDVPAFAAWMSRLRDLGLDEQCYILAGVGPILSLRALSHLQDKVPGVHVPEPVADRLRRGGEDRLAEEGERLCAEIVGQLREIPGVAGVHVMAVANERRIPGILRQAGLAARPGGPVPASTAQGSTAQGSTGAH